MFPTLYLKTPSTGVFFYAFTVFRNELVFYRFKFVLKLKHKVCNKKFSKTTNGNNSQYAKKPQHQ